MVKKTTNTLTADRTTTPLTQETKKLLEKKVVQKTTANMPKRSTLRPEKPERYDGPQGQKVETQEEHYAKTRGHWDAPAMGEFQPQSGHGKTMTVSELPIYPDEFPLSQGGPVGKEPPVKPLTTTTAATVQKGQWSYDAAKGLGQEDNG